MGVGHGVVASRSDACTERPVTSPFINPSWMPHSVGEAARAGDATADDLVSGRAWSHLLDGLRKAADVVLSDDVPRNPADMAAGFRHLLGLLGTGLDHALRAEPDPVLAVKPSGMDAVYKWGMDCPDCIYTGAPLRGGESYRLLGQPRVGALRRAAVDGRDGVVGQRAPRRARPRARGRGGARPLGGAPRGQLAAHRRGRHGAGGAALLLRLGHRGGLLAAHRADRRGQGENAHARPRTRGRWSPASWSRWGTSWSPTSTSSCSSPGPRRPTRSSLRSTARPWGPRRRTGP